MRHLLIASETACNPFADVFDLSVPGSLKAALTLCLFGRASDVSAFFERYPGIESTDAKHVQFALNSHFLDDVRFTVKPLDEVLGVAS